MGFFPVIAHIDLYFDSWEQTVRQNIEVYGKGAKKEAHVTLPCYSWDIDMDQLFCHNRH